MSGTARKRKYQRRQKSMRGLKRMSGGAAIIQLVKSLAATPNTAELNDIVDDIKDDIQDIGAITAKIDVKVQDLETASGKVAKIIKAELTHLKKEERVEIADGNANLLALTRKMKELSANSAKKANAVRDRISKILPSLKNAPPNEIKSVCDSIIKEVLHSQKDKVAKLNDLEKLFAPVRTNSSIGAEKLLNDIKIDRKNDAKQVAEMMALHKEMMAISEIKGGVGVGVGVGVGSTNRQITDTYSARIFSGGDDGDDSMVKKLYNLGESLLIIASSYLTALVGLNLIARLIICVGPTLTNALQYLLNSIKSGITYLTTLNGNKHPVMTTSTTTVGTTTTTTSSTTGNQISDGVFNLFTFHPWYTVIVAILIGLAGMFYFSRKEQK